MATLKTHCSAQLYRLKQITDPFPMKIRWIAALTASFSIAGCSGERVARPDIRASTLVISAGGQPDILFPPLMATLPSRQISDLVFEHLAEPGDSLRIDGDAGFVPAIAKSWTWSSDSLAVVFQVDPRARWHDGRPVRSDDVQFTFDLYRDPVTASQRAAALENISGVRTVDSLAVEVRFRRRSPQQFFDAVYHVHILPAHVWKGVDRSRLREHSAARSPIGSGRYRFGSWTAGESIELNADSMHYRGAPRIPRVLWRTAADYSAAIKRLLGGEADVFEAVRTEYLPAVARNPSLKLLPYTSSEYGVLTFNLRSAAGGPHPLFSDRALRRAITMGIDRDGIVRSVFDSLAVVAVGPLVRRPGSRLPVIRQLPFDTAAAARALDSLGWRRGDDGFRSRAGRPLRFTLNVPSSSENRVRLAVLIQAMLANIGIRVITEQSDFSAFVDRETRRDFDALIHVWHADPGYGALRYTWGSPGAVRGGANFGSYRNPVFDADVDSALRASAPGVRDRHLDRAYQTIVEDAPAVWLFEPIPLLGVSRRVNVVGVRPDAWWAGIGRWTITR